MLACCTATKPMPEPLVITKEVKVPVPIPCPYVINRPPFDDEKVGMAGDILDVVKKFQSGVVQRTQYINELEGAIKVCQGTK